MTSVAIVGAGIVGTATAFELARSGCDVTVFDPHPAGEGGASFGNASHIGLADIHPLSTPGIHITAARMLMNRDGPLKIPLTDVPRYAGWFWKFWRTSQGTRFQNATAALTELGRTCRQDTTAMFKAAQIGHKLKFDGAAYVYDNHQSFSASLSGWADKAAAGHLSDVWSETQIRDHLPCLNPKFRHSVRLRSWGQVTDSLEVVQDIAAAAANLGVRFMQRPVQRLSVTDAGVELVAHGEIHRADYCVLAAGVATGALARQMGDRLPLAAERGYNLTFPTADVGDVDLPLVFADRGVVATQVTGGLRVGGWAEYTRPDRPPNPAYFQSLFRISAELFPGINTAGAVAWWGNRPSLPDSIPVISVSRHTDRIIYNCGHGHYGLTHAARSARIAASLLSGSPDPAAQMYSITRF